MIINGRDLLPIPVCTVQHAAGNKGSPRLTVLTGYRITKHFVVASPDLNCWRIYNGHGRTGPAFPYPGIAADMAADLEEIDFDWSLPSHRRRTSEAKAVVDKYRHCEV